MLFSLDIDNLWNDEYSIIKIFFNKKLYFTRQLETELNKREDNAPICTSEPEVKLDSFKIDVGVMDYNFEINGILGIE
ncbi:hypothetical protein psyc5s11_19970 [Clostridium gelidum]|uniref:Uncharacterized protein n=1 Tax=Clostridium gelidum TaxID=704125 RepID=A0ABM7TA98_9CLOT|nr:hypothetical protein [Clostridium gelidum]BCZ45930.1 hypothetical protein psyc5s11_19970 [Clostridium gelidum]